MAGQKRRSAAGRGPGSSYRKPLFSA